MLEAVVRDVAGRKVRVSTAAGDFLSTTPEWLSERFSEGMRVAYVVEAHRIGVGNAFENRVLGRIVGRVLDGSREILEVSVANLGNIKCERAKHSWGGHRRRGEGRLVVEGIRRVRSPATLQLEKR